jgi:predicted nucleic-acid-binding protein
MSASADSNVLVRLFAADDAEQTRRSQALLASVEDASASLFVPQIVLCELVWVLARRYRFSRQRIGEVIETLIATGSIALEGPDDVRAALAAFRAGRGDFSDYLIRERARRAGMLPVTTFDEDVMDEDGFAPPEGRRGRPGGDRVSEPAPRYRSRPRRRRRSPER